MVIAGQSDSKLDGLAGAVHLPDDPARAYLASAQQDFSGTQPEATSPLLKAVSGEPDATSIRVKGSTRLVAHAASIDGVPYLFIANFEGLKGGEQLTPSVQNDVRIEVPSSFGTSMHLLPFLGEESILKGQQTGSRIAFVVPSIERGAVVWFK